MASAMRWCMQKVMKRRCRDEKGIEEICSINRRYLLPCSHQIQSKLPIDARSIHPHWRLQVTLPPIETQQWQALERGASGCPKGTRTMQNQLGPHKDDRIEKADIPKFRVAGEGPSPEEDDELQLMTTTLN
ncbi:hypothetical protein V1520DRAFT_353838 [Lipomyces starkeyi]